MRLRNIWIVYLKELTEALRDRRTLITTFLVPLLLIPVLGDCRQTYYAVLKSVSGLRNNSARNEPATMCSCLQG